MTNNKKNNPAIKAAIIGAKIAIIVALIGLIPFFYSLIKKDKSITNDIPPKVYERLLKTLDELDKKDIEIQDRDKLISEWKVKYKEIEKRLAARSGDNELIAKAKEKLSNGDFDGAEKLLEQSFKQDLKKRQIADNKLAQSAYELGLVKELKLEYKNALFYFEKACKYNPENGLYLNELGLIFITLGKYKKAVEYLEKALKSDLKTYGLKHPKVATLWNNLGGA